MKEGHVKIEDNEIISSSIPLINLSEGKLSFPEVFLRPGFYVCVGDKLTYKPAIAFKEGEVILTVPKNGSYIIKIGGY